MRRFFLDIPSLDLNDIILPPDEAKHIVKVLRMQVGDKIEVINGNGEVLTAEITLAEPKNVIAKQIAYKKETPDSFHIHIAIAPTKNNDRFEWFLEKATELGVHEITPILCTNSERTKIKKERFEKIIVAATKQSKRLFKPKLNDLTPFNTFVEKHQSGLIAHCYNNEERNTSIYAQLEHDKSKWEKSNTPILIGPEGDFSLNEVKFALENGYQAVSLGKTRLRTETAGVYACMNLKLFFEEKV